MISTRILIVEEKDLQISRDKKESVYKHIFLKLASCAILRMGWNTTARRPEYEVVGIELCSIKRKVKRSKDDIQN